MATEQSIRVSAKGEFGQLQRGLKDLQGDLKNVVGEINKGARKGGIFDDSNLRALDLYKKRLKDTMGEVDKQFEKQNSEIDRLYEKMNRANEVEKSMISNQIKAREKELDVIRKQLLTVEEIYKKRNSEAGTYEIKAPRGSSGGNNSSSESMVPSAMNSIFGKAMGVVGTVAKFATGLAGLTSLVGLGQRAYQLAYERQVESLDLAQRLRGHGFSGDNLSMYNQVSKIGLRDNMGYSARDSWATQQAYTEKAGTLGSEGQFVLQKFARGYGLDAAQVAGVAGGVKQLGGVSQPKQFADMIAGSVSQSGMLPRIMEVMQTHTRLLQSLNTTYKDGSSAQILAYQTTLDKIGNANGMTQLTGQNGANVIQGLGGIFSPSNDKWKWMGIASLQHYKPDKYGSMGLYDLEKSFEQGLVNPDNLPAMSGYLKEQSGGNNQVFKRLMQSWLQDGGLNITKGQIDELDQVTNGFTAFNEGNINKVIGTNKNTDSGAKYDTERSGEEGQRILQVDAKFDQALAEVGQKYLLEPITDMKEDFTGILDALNGDQGLPGILKAIEEMHPWIKGILAAMAISAGIGVVKGAGSLFKGIGNLFKKGKGAGGAAKEGEEIIDDILQGKGTSGEIELGKNIKSGALSKAEDAMLDKYSGGNKALKSRMEQIYRSTGDMDVVKNIANGGKYSPGEVIDMVSNGDSTVAKQLTEHYGKTGDIGSTIDKAKEIAEGAEKGGKGGIGGFFSKIFKSKGVTEGVESAGKFSKLFKGAGKAISKVPILGTLIDFGINKFTGDSTGRAATRAVGSGLGGWGGAAAGAAAGTLIFPGVGTAIGGILGGIGGGVAGDKLSGGIFDFFKGNHDDGIKKDQEQVAAIKDLSTFANKGQVDIDGLSNYGLQKLEELRDKGLIQFTELNTSSSATLTGMSEAGKKSLIDLQEKGLISIGGLQADGTAKVTALSTEGRDALTNLKKEGVINMTDLNATGKVRITNLSEEGSKQILNLQKNGSLSLTSMDATTTKKLKEIKEDSGTQMNNIYKEHKGLKDKLGDIFNPLTKQIGDWFGGFWGALKGFLGMGDSSSGKSSSGSGVSSHLGTNDVRKMSGVTSTRLNGALGGALKGYGTEFIEAGQKYGIDPAFLAAIAMHETGNGTSSAVRNKNNVGGMMGANGLMSFSSIAAGIEAMAKNLKNLYINQGLTTPEAIQKRYAPIGASNDPTSLNGYWITGVENFWNQLGGGQGDSTVGINPANSFFDGWQGKVTSSFGANRGDHAHGGLDIGGNQGDMLSALKGGKVSFLYMDDGGKYDSDGSKNTRAGGTEMGIQMPDGSTYFYSHMSNVNPDILKRWQSGDRNIDIGAGDWLGNVGGTPGIGGSGYSTTGSHLHLGYMNSNGVLQDPRNLLNSLNIGDSSIGTMGAMSAGSQELYITVDVNLKGEGAAQLNSSTASTLKSLIQQTVAEMERQKLAMNPVTRR